jgi:hypothetical protein
VNALGDSVNFPCWSKVEDKDINEAYCGAMEVEEGDKAGLTIESVSDASNVEVVENKGEEEKPYTEQDLKDAEKQF